MEERLKELRKCLHLNQADFSKRINLGQSTLAMIEVGKRSINDRHIKLICAEFNVNEDWLRNGTGNMFIQNTSMTLDEYAKSKDVSELELAIMRAYMDIDKETRSQLLAKIEKAILVSHNSASDTLLDVLSNESTEDLEAIYKKSRSNTAQKTTSSASSITSVIDSSNVVNH